MYKRQAHTHALAMADAQAGQVISGRCYLSWPLTDKERDAGEDVYKRQGLCGRADTHQRIGVHHSRSGGQL